MLLLHYSHYKIFRRENRFKLFQLRIHTTSAEFYPFLCHFLRLQKNGNNTKYSGLTIVHGLKKKKEKGKDTLLGKESKS